MLIPSLCLLFGLFLRGHLSAGDAVHPVFIAPAAAPARQGRLETFALACLVIGTGLLIAADSGWARAVGVVALFAFAASGFAIVARVADDWSDTPG